MNSSPRQSATSVGSDSSSIYSDDGHKSNSKLTGTHDRSHRNISIWGMPRENRDSFREASTVSNARDITTPDLDENQGSSRDVLSMRTAAYRFETMVEAEERRSRSAAQARSGQHNMWRDTGLDEPRTYMQQVLAEHDAASARQSSNRYSFRDKHTEEPIRQSTEPSRRHLQVVSADDIPSRHMRTTLLSTISLASTHSGELREELACETGAYHDMPQECIHSSETACGFCSKPATPRSRPMSISATPSELWLDHHNSLALDREVHQSAALSALAGANNRPGEAMSGESSSQRLGGAARHSSLAARRRGRVDWQKSGLFSSTGRQYGLGDRELGYVSGKYVTFLRDDAPPEKETRKRDTWKRML